MTQTGKQIKLRQRKMKSDRHTVRQTERERQRQRERQTDREREGEREREREGRTAVVNLLVLCNHLLIRNRDCCACPLGKLLFSLPCSFPLPFCLQRGRFANLTSRKTRPIHNCRYLSRTLTRFWHHCWGNSWAAPLTQMSFPMHAFLAALCLSVWCLEAAPLTQRSFPMHAFLAALCLSVWCLEAAPLTQRSFPMHAFQAALYLSMWHLEAAVSASATALP